MFVIPGESGHENTTFLRTQTKVHFFKLNGGMKTDCLT